MFLKQKKCKNNIYQIVFNYPSKNLLYKKANSDQSYNKALKSLQRKYQITTRISVKKKFNIFFFLVEVIMVLTQLHCDIYKFGKFECEFHSTSKLIFATLEIYP